MKRIEPLNSFDKIKILSAPHRLDILQRLMAAPATLTQLGQALGQSPAWVRHHIKALEAAGLIEIAETRAKGIVVEKYYRACAGAYLLQQMVLPAGRHPVLAFSGSHDLALELLSDQLAPHVSLLSLPVGSLNGLVNLRQGLCQISGSHLRDENGGYNVAYVHHLFPDRLVSMVTFAYRTQGLIVAARNPKKIKTLFDLMRPDVIFLNRNLGSGTRLWLDSETARIGLPVAKIRGYEHSVNTHTESAQAVAEGRADATLGLQAAAHQFELSFIPLFEERYDLVFPPGVSPALDILLDHIQTGEFRRSMAAMSGYQSTHTGEQIPL